MARVAAALHAVHPGAPVVGPRDVTAAELPPRGDDRPAAVLCLLFDLGGTANVVLTRRAKHLRDHAGEVSFPGGRLGPGEVALAAALREAEEEVGVPSSCVSLLGELTPLTTRHSPALVRCFVATFEGPASLASGGMVINDEVERVFWASLSRLAAPGVFHEELWPVPGAGEPGGGGAEEGTYLAVPFFQLDEEVVWGATGRLLVELLSIVLALPSQGVAGDGTLGES